MSASAVDHLDPLVSFGQALRQSGLVVGTERVMGFCEATALAPGANLYWVGRATLVSRPEDLATYDRVFRQHFLGVQIPEPPLRNPQQSRPTPSPFLLEGDMTLDEPVPEVAPASATEALRHKSFAVCSEAELADIARLMARLRLDAPARLTRRRQPSRRGQPDLRRTLRKALRTGGDPINRAWTSRRPKRRRIVFLLDVSGSMSAYSRALAMFAYAALRADTRFEAFSFGTRLTRLTWSLVGRTPDDALRRVASEVSDWDGGTRIGLSLKALLDRSGYARLVRGAVVIITSDGLDVGDPELVREQMARLRRLAHRVVWLNPLKANAAYEPLAQGMSAALPYIDVFASGHDLASLDAIAGAVAQM